MTYDDWKTTDPSAADYCCNGHYHCPPCPIDEGTERAHASCSCDHQSDDMEADRVECEFCGLLVATPQDGEMQATDPRCATLCWSNEDNAKFCTQDPRHPDARHKAACGCEDCRACAGDAEYDRRKDERE